MHRLILNVMLATASCVVHAAPPSPVSANVLERLQERIYGHPITVQGQLGDGYRTANYRDLSARIGKAFAVQREHLPLDSSLADAARLVAVQVPGTRAYRKALHSLNLPGLDVDLELRIREISAMQLTAAAKATEQRMYWDVYEGMLGLQEQEQARHEVPEQPAPGIVAGRLARLIHLLRLTPAEIAALSRYDEVALLRRIFSEHDLSFAAPSIIDASNRRNTSMHAISSGGRSCFEGRAILGNAAAGDSKLLSDWRAKRELEQQVLNQEIPAEQFFNSPLPDYPPSGTVLVLLRYMIVFDDANVPRVLPVVETAAVRFFSSPDGKSRNESYALYELDQGASTKAGDWRHTALPAEEVVWSGLLNGRPDRLSAQGLALITTMSNNCAFCHNFAAPGPGQLVAFSVGRPSTSSKDAVGQCTLTLRYLEGTAAYAQLHAQLQRLDRETP